MLAPLLQPASPRRLAVVRSDAPEPFVQVPLAIVRDERLNATGLRLYLILLHYTRQGDGCWPAVATLCQDMGHCHRNTITTALAELTACGLVEVVRRGLGRSNVYRLTRPDAQKTVPIAPYAQNTVHNAPTAAPYAQATVHNEPAEEDPYAQFSVQPDAQFSVHPIKEEIDAKKNTQLYAVAGTGAPDATSAADPIIPVAGPLSEPAPPPPPPPADPAALCGMLGIPVVGPKGAANLAAMTAVATKYAAHLDPQEMALQARLAGCWLSERPKRARSVAFFCNWIKRELGAFRPAAAQSTESTEEKNADGHHAPDAGGPAAPAAEPPYTNYDRSYEAVQWRQRERYKREHGGSLAGYD